MGAAASLDMLDSKKRRMLKATRQNTKANAEGFIGVKTPRPQREENQAAHIKSHAHHYHVGFETTLQSRSFFLEQAPTTISRKNSDESDNEEANGDLQGAPWNSLKLPDVLQQLSIHLPSHSQETEPVIWKAKPKPSRRRHSARPDEIAALPLLRRAESEINTRVKCYSNIVQGSSGPSSRMKLVRSHDINSHRRKVQGKSWGLTDIADTGVTISHRS